MLFWKGNAERRIFMSSPELFISPARAKEDTEGRGYSFVLGKNGTEKRRCRGKELQGDAGVEKGRKALLSEGWEGS